MTAQILHIDAFRPTSEIEKQIDYREMIIRQTVREMDGIDKVVCHIVGLACDAAADAVRDGKGFFEAMEAARKVIERNK